MQWQIADTLGLVCSKIWNKTFEWKTENLKRWWVWKKTAGCREVILQIQDGDWSSCGSAIPRWSVLERRNCQTGDLMLTPSTGSHRSYSGNVKISNKFCATSNKCFIIIACCILTTSSLVFCFVFNFTLKEISLSQQQNFKSQKNLRQWIWLYPSSLSFKSKTYSKLFGFQ